MLYGDTEREHDCAISEKKPKLCHVKNVKLEVSFFNTKTIQNFFPNFELTLSFTDGTKIS